MKTCLIRRAEVILYMAALMIVLLENFLSQEYKIVIRATAMVIMSISNILTMLSLDNVSPRQYIGAKVALVFNAICFSLIRTKCIPIPIIAVLIASLGVVISVNVETIRKTANSASFYNHMLWLHLSLLSVSIISTLLSYIL